MQKNNLKYLIVAAYVVIVGSLGMLSGVTSPFGWVALAALTVGPPVALMIFWKDPSRSMSESIQAGRR